MNTGWQRVLGLSCIRLTGVVLQTVILLVVGRIAGPAGVGTLQLFLAWTCSLGELAAAGLPTHAMRRMVQADECRASALQYFAKATSRLAGVWLVLMLVAFVLYAFGWIQSGLHLGFVAVSVFCFALYRIASESLKAVGQVDASVLVESALPPVVAGTVIGTRYFLYGEITSLDVIGAFSAGFFITAFVLVLRLLKYLGGMSNRRAVAPNIAWQEHAPYWVTALVSIGFLNYPFLVLPYFATLAEIGSFAFAFKLLNLSTTILLMLGAIYGPRFAKSALSGDKFGARRLLGQTQKLSLMLYVPMVVVLLVGYPFIHPLFGDGFGDALPILLVLAIGQLCGAMTGLSGQLLNMSGEGAKEMNIQLATLAIAIGLTSLAGNAFGAMGIAMVYSLTISLKSIASLWTAYQLVGRDSPHFTKELV